MDERPAPSPEKLLSQFRDWTAGDELPGRTMSYLKTGFLDEVLNGLDPSDDIAAMLEHWSEWEAGKTNPESVLQTLKERGLETLLGASS